MNFIKLSIISLALASLVFAGCSRKTTGSQSTNDSTVTERSASPERGQPERGQGQRGQGQRGQGERPQFSDLLARMDSNNDGKLSATEVEGRLKERFKMIDTNGDGFIIEEEFKNAPRPERGNRGPRKQ